MEDASDVPNHDFPPIESPNLPKDASLSDLESLRISYQELQSRSLASEETISDLRTKLREAEISAKEREDSILKEKLDLASEAEVFRARVSELLEERSRKVRVFSGITDSLQSVQECLRRIGERFDEEKFERRVEEEVNLEDELHVFLLETRYVYELGMAVESRFMRYEEMRRKERKQLENSIVSLTEENRDIGSLLRIALVEKEAVERSLSRLKGSGEQKRVAILQIAERGLQKVGFGFMMGTSAVESQSDNQSSSNASTRSDGSECEEEVVSLASTVEKIMKNLRLEISELKRSLYECRSDIERLQSLTVKQAQKITESTLHIKDLEERENTLTQNVEELMMEITEAEEEATRWREACELEVEAGKAAIEDRERQVAMLIEELKMTKTALNLSNGKLKLKEKLAATAMAAQAAAVVSLQLADNRSIGFRDRIEELTRQLEEEAERGRRERSRGRRRVRHVCWPWRALRITPTGTDPRGRSRIRRMMPEMEALLHFNI